MNFEPVVKIINILLILEIFIGIQASHIQDAKSRIREEIRHAIGPDRILPRKEISEIEHDVRQPTHKIEQRRWSHRRRLGAQFTPWTEWSECDTLCRKTRESYCKVKRKCGDTKHVEERECRRCHIRHQTHSNAHLYHTNVNYGINEQHSLRYHHEPNTNGISLPYNRLRLPVYQEIYEPEDDRDYYVIKKRPRYKKKRKPILIEVDDYEDLEDEDPIEEVKYKRFKVKSIRTKNWNRDTLHKEDFGDHSIRNYYDDISKRRNLYPQTGSPGYEDDEYAESKDNVGPLYVNNEYEDEYEETYLGRNSPPFKGANNTIIGGITSTTTTTTTTNPNNAPREKAVFELPPRYKRVYSRWSKWSKCSPKCTTRRYKKCRMKDICGKEVLREIAYCYTEGSFCQQWLETQAHKTPPYDLRPVATSRKDVVSPNAIENDFVLTGRGYRGPEYTPLKLKCGIPSIRNSRRNNLNNMLKIIGGRTSRKGQWPWQVVIFNRFKEAFCGGTLIAPTWVLTAAHCVRKVLYVRIGEHNLDVEDGTEIEFRVLKSIKHPNYDKKTVDSDVALLRLPQPVNNTNWIGYACMPRPYQSLPKNIQCTVIGWGKRRNRDQAGTSLLHQAEVPIIPMDNCKAVYYDYTITKNMFCAGHKRGRIDTCAGDSGGPLLCRDGTKPNHPWTIFGITSFGDGCAKRNKFGIYAKVPNYVDWVWSVVNCNGNCKSTNRRT